MVKKRYRKPKFFNLVINEDTSLLAGSSEDEIGQGSDNGDLESKDSNFGWDADDNDIFNYHW